MRKLTLAAVADEELRSRRVLVRVDYNVPLEDGRVGDDTRIVATLPTLDYLLERDARVILVSHLGRPKGHVVPEMSLRPVAARLAELVEAKVTFVPDVAGEEAREAASKLGDREILMLENVRFLAGEEKDDPGLAASLADLADIYVDDAFGAAHRAHASTAGVAEIMKERGRLAVAGLLMERELRFLGQALESPERPFAAILGGSKISGKIDVIENLLPRVDRLLIGGAMANTFFRALGLDTGRSLVEEERVGMARHLLETAGDQLLLPVDCVVASRPAEDAERMVVERTQIPEDMMVLDIGPASVSGFRAEVGRAATILWNGPVGMFEVAPFAEGTFDLARAIADATGRGATTIIGGGDTAAAAREAGVADRMTHVSTGGGASLEFLEGKTLPGVAALSDGADR